MFYRLASRTRKWKSWTESLLWLQCPHLCTPPAAGCCKSDHLFASVREAEKVRKSVRIRWYLHLWSHGAASPTRQLTGFLSNERSSLNDGKKFNGVPDLVVEILSDSTEKKDRTFKFREYAIGGAREYWMISLDKKEIEVYQNSERGFQLVKIFTRNDILITPLLNEINIEINTVFD